MKETSIIANQRSTLVAFTVGEKYQPGGEFKVPVDGHWSLNKGGKQRLCDTSAVHLIFKDLIPQVIGAHTDSPVLKVKPVSAKTANGYIQVMSET